MKVEQSDGGTLAMTIRDTKFVGNIGGTEVRNGLKSLHVRYVYLFRTYHHTSWLLILFDFESRE